MTGGRSVIVVAHPDDECLWLSSVLATADRVVFCFGDQFERPKSSAARRRAVAALPLAGLTDLKLPESGAGFSVDWANPQPTETGIAVVDEAARGCYEANFSKLLDALRSVLADCDNVYTHNPWGEYGHADHIQVYRAVAALQDELGYTIWFSNYVGPASWPLALKLGAQPSWTHCHTVSPDKATALGLMRVYRRYGAWTWTRFHRWPELETLYAQPAGGDMLPLTGEWLLDITGLRWWPTPWRKARRYLHPTP